ncbi:1-(5-phosphoribosyl)-5-[(5-phosphoribosylamino)methylideneamino]imidazole-4-carboxamide isomerase [Bacteroidota bacterium]
MEIIPAIDIINGKCVRLTKGDYSTEKIYSENPVEIAGLFEDHGISRLHLVDLDGAKEKRVINLPILKEISANTTLSIDFGGGVQSNKDIELVFNAGARQVTGGSVAVKNEVLFQEWLLKYGPDKIILGADVMERTIAVHGWKEDSGIDLFDFLEKYIHLGIQYVICTDVGRDGVLEGPATKLYGDVLNSYPDLKLIASGGVSCLEDLDRLKQIGVFGVIIGKAIYENRIDLKELERFL